VRTDRSAGAAIPCEDAAHVTREDRLALFRLVLVHRLIEERVGLLYRQGRISGSVYTGRGQEAVGAAAGYALGPDDVCAPLNRELACHLARGVTTAEAFRNFLGKGDSPTQGRDGNMHFGAPEHGVFPLVSMLGVGELRIRKGGSEESFAIAGGFLQVRPDRVVVMAETADLASEIDLEKAQEARREAERALEGAAPTDAVDLAAARAQLQTALLRIRVAERRHREGPRHRG